MPFINERTRIKYKHLGEKNNQNETEGNGPPRCMSAIIRFENYYRLQLNHRDPQKVPILKVDTWIVPITK